MLQLETFHKRNYDVLLSWIDSDELLMQFAGPAFTFPLTSEQLDKSLSDEKRFAFNITDGAAGVSIGYAEIYLGQESAFLGRILIGDKKQRGKGYGQEIVRLLLDYAFTTLHQTKAQLNVFDWNTSAIKCYEKAGFSINPEKKAFREINGQQWTATNMTLTKEKWGKRLS